MSKPTAKELEAWPLVNGKKTNPIIVPALNLIRPEVYNWAKPLITQIYGHATQSGSTHADGCAVDFVTKTLSNEQIRVLDSELKKAGFMPVLRLKGDDVGTGPIVTEHIHAAYPGHSNYMAIVQSAGQFGKWRIDKQLKRRGKK